MAEACRDLGGKRAWLDECKVCPISLRSNVDADGLSEPIYRTHNRRRSMREAIGSQSISLEVSVSR